MKLKATVVDEGVNLHFRAVTPHLVGGRNLGARSVLSVRVATPERSRPWTS
jgi:hypothetical protein